MLLISLYVRCVFILADGLNPNDANGLLKHSNFDCKSPIECS